MFHHKITHLNDKGKILTSLLFEKELEVLFVHVLESIKMFRTKKISTEHN